MTVNRQFNCFETPSSFVNICLTELYGNLPSYCYYDSNDNLSIFWNELKSHDYSKIYSFLLMNNYIVKNIKYTRRQHVQYFVKYFINPMLL